jgi:UDP-glucuronate 4-epimerase
MRILVTGAAGFIGFHVAARLLRDGATVLGIDNLNGYYDPRLKRSRLALLEHARFEFAHLDIADRPAMETLFAREEFSQVIHLAAQAGVRHSIDRPHDYVDSNITGFLHVLEGCRRARVGHLIYASSSSVYGGNTKIPFAVEDRVDRPISLYAATKKANELMAHSYAHLFRIPMTGLRFFTVYGPWGRPDMAPYKFARAIVRGDVIDIFNYGRMERDFTYIDDIVEGVVRVLSRPPVAAAASVAPSAIYNIGNHTAIELETFISELERLLGVRAIREYEPLQPGDVPATFASIERLAAAIGFAPSTPLHVGLASFVRWYREYYREGQSS